MKLNNFIEGLNILRKYYDNPDEYHSKADHGLFYAYETDRPLTTDDVAKMRELGWFQSDAHDDVEYDPTEGWSAFM